MTSQASKGQSLTLARQKANVSCKTRANTNAGRAIRD